VFIIPGTVGGIIMWIWFPNTNGLPLEEIAAIFGDEDDVAVYQREINVQDGRVIDLHADVKEKQGVYTENLAAGDGTRRV